MAVADTLRQIDIIPAAVSAIPNALAQSKLEKPRLPLGGVLDAFTIAAESQSGQEDLIRRIAAA